MPDRLPILYSFRRCPYAMRARLAIRASGVTCELREVVLRDKAPEFLAASSKATVPVLVPPKGAVIEQSLDVMLWALAQNDPKDWLHPQTGTRAQMMALIRLAEDDFKPNLDRTKYASRYPQADRAQARNCAAGFLMDLNALLAKHSFLFGNRAALADMAIAPFVRQFASIDRPWFDSQPWPELVEWLDKFLQSVEFTSVMTKYAKWQAGDPVIVFPERGSDAS